MTDALFSAIDLPSDTHAGYRLRHVEVFNWGTFDKRVWRLTPDGDTTLLTGDIGSGKSTMVDAITTLLLPAHRITYNKAAGAEAKERTLRSYVEGHYKSERIEASGLSRAIGLRDHRTYSVILGVFVNEGFDETVTVAQVFHQKDRAGQPDRFFVTSAKELSIEADFTDFGSDLVTLRKRLRAGGADIFNSFPEYSRQMRRLLGIRSEQAMELFGQTVSMKSVGNLNEFVRNHMLERIEPADKIRGIVEHFENLMKAHEAVTRAREQLEVLAPLVITSNAYDAALTSRSDLQAQRQAVRLFIAELRTTLLDAEIEADSHRREQLLDQDREAEQRRAALIVEREGLITARAQAGGNRVTELERIAADARRQTQERRARRVGFDEQVQAAGLEPVADADAFAVMADQLAVSRQLLEVQRQELDDQVAGLAGEVAQLRKEGDEVRAELASLATRTSNLPTAQLQVRERMCQDLGIRAQNVPFAGELLDVSEEHTRWRGAAERVLRGFALSMLVPQDLYQQVSRWVNDNRLEYRRSDGRTAGSRLVYERVSTRRVPLQATPASGLILADTLDIADGPFRDYLRDELTRRADYRCVESMEAFRAEQRAVTLQGQVRSGGRHEKDDRSRVDDPRGWVLGWVNERKVQALTEHMLSLQQRLLTAEDGRKAVQEQGRRVADQLMALARLEVYGSWAELDWAEAQQRADAAEAERQRLLAGSSALAEIEGRLEANTLATHEAEAGLRAVREDLSRLKDRIERACAARSREQAFVADVPDSVLEAARAVYGLLEKRLGKALPRTADLCQGAADSLTDGLSESLTKVQKDLDRQTNQLLRQMAEFRRRWPEGTADMDASVEARAEYRIFHDRVANDDLPRFEAEFKTELNTNAIRELAQFNNWLRRQADDIHSRVDLINEALGAIDYSPGRYIRLEVERTVNQEVQSFRSDLRSATDDSLAPGEDDHYSERRFLEVKRIIERLRGRDGHTDTDRAWTKRVTDVRNWFTFSGSERDRVTDEEWEHYRDSDGKSGGQKEKLAYTILAASLAYQFGLEWGVRRSRDFRFAVIDEAFGRGSDASTRFALDLFAKLGLQLLIVTPLQKVHVIAPYVHAIGFVDNPDGNYSRLQTMTIEEFHEQHRGGLPG